MTGDNPLNLDETAEWAGLWWLSDRPHERLPGVLRYDGSGGLSLSLIGAFEDRIMSHPRPGVTAVHEGRQTWDVIHGVAEQREITLLQCVPTGGKRTMFARVESPDKQIVTATFAVIGVHANGEVDPVFSAMEISIEDLGVWASSSVFEGHMGTSDGKFDGTGTISAKPVENVSVTVDGTEYHLSHTHTLPFFDHRKGSTIGRMRDTVAIRVIPSAPSSLAGAMEAARQLQDLIAVAMHRAAGLIWLRLAVAGTASVLPDGSPAPRRYAHVLYSPAALGRHDAKAVNEHQAFFTCGVLPFEEVVPRWCEVHERLQASINMILGLRYAPARFVENNLLTAVGAAEVLHRGLRIDEKPFPQAQFRTMREAMLSQVPAEHRDRFRRAVRNDPTLRDRLLALAARPDSQAMAVLVPNAELWAKRTTQARNDLAHEGTTRSHSSLELVAVVNVTTAVVILNVLHEIGLSSEQQREIVRNHPQLRATSQAGRQWFGRGKAD
ncbi:hypothetical protein SAMN05660766_2246 [Curtobacterium sp. 314Chir4.1]|uniref:ApeA N-terminal domain 1-containing protein n=1 Tax=Curtobacterium sp. 314Chir4.1 TaxID=1279028 RepID=UPI000BCCD1D2|nr:HEPN domain-containing protein [Curtobacterium sp. 314Chir4.1]SOC88539.1 hypothetical protein SAMN05660766_2246 [Curtobacterium sp. 314Chir4.1]